MTTNTHLLKTSSLSYHYGKDAQTLFDLNLQVEKGAIYGFLGPNGSGKTTTLSLLLGLLNNQKGEIEIFGQHLREHRTAILKKIGSLIETPSLYGHLNARENREVYRPVYGVAKERIGEVLDIVGLNYTGKKPVKKFSLGMKQRLSIALALLPRPELLVLDEPTNGLDPAGIIELRELIKKLNREQGMTILISSHLLAEVEKMVTHVGIIYQGRMRFQGPLADLHRMQQKSARLQLQTSDNEAAGRLLHEHFPDLGSVRHRDAMIEVSCPTELAEVAHINRTLTAAGLDLYLLHPRQSDLEQLFMDLTTATA